jgi:hypothetical protein
MIHNGIQLASCGVTGQSWRGEGHRATTPRIEKKDMQQCKVPIKDWKEKQGW